MKQQLDRARDKIVSISNGGELVDAGDDVDKHFLLERTSSTATKHLSPKGQMALAIRRNISNIAAKVFAIKFWVPG